jgi:hypothetical protein
VNKSLISEMLTHLSEDYKVLEINSKRIFRYHSTYFDTDDFRLYKMHHSGKLNRYKVRYRSYFDSNSTYFEIKQKDNHGRTLKSRIETENDKKPFLNSEETKYLESNTPLTANELEYKLAVEYDRITLVNIDKTERITIDLNLTYKIKNNLECFSEMAIVEVKQQNKTNTPAKIFLKKSKIRMGGISKYCLGVILFFENINHNRFKHKYNKIYKPFKLVS